MPEGQVRELILEITPSSGSALSGTTLPAGRQASPKGRRGF